MPRCCFLSAFICHHDFITPGVAHVPSTARQVGWDGERFDKDPSVVEGLRSMGGLSTSGVSAAAVLGNLPKYMDVVIPSIRDLDFLNEWRQFLEGFHLILVQVEPTPPFLLLLLL